jgi:hypothetical protein
VTREKFKGRAKLRFQEFRTQVRPSLNFCQLESCLSPATPTPTPKTLNDLDASSRLVNHKVLKKNETKVKKTENLNLHYRANSD